MRNKLFSIAMSLLLISSLALAACGKPAEQSAPAPNNNEPKAETPVEKAPEQDTPEGFIPATDKSKIPAASKNRTDTIIVGMQQPDGIFNPFYRSTAYDAYVIKTIFNSLVEVDFDASYIPGLAKSWDIEGNTYTFHLRDDVKFSDGTPMTSADVEFSYYLLADPTFDGRADLSKAKIVGFDAYKNGNAETIEGIKIVDEHTIQVEVEEPLAITLANLGIDVLPKHYYGKDFSKGNTAGVKALHQKPLGSGQYVLQKYVPGQEVQLVANEHHWKGVAKIKNLIFKATTDETNMQMIQTGETDFEEGISVNQDALELLQSYGFVDISLLLNNGYGYIGFNHNLPKFQDKRVRQALAYGLNREEIVYAYSQGTAEVIDVPQSKLSWSYPPEDMVTHYEFNLEKANQLLDEAGWERGADGYRYKDGEKFVINFAATSPNPVNDAIIPYAVENYKELGIEFIPEQLEFNAVVAKKEAKDIEMYFLAWSLVADPDPYGTFHTKGTNNDLDYSNPKVDELIEAGLKELDQEKRAKIYHELFKELNEDLPYIFMYQRKNMNVINSRLNGFEISPYRDFTHGLHAVEIE